MIMALSPSSKAAAPTRWVGPAIPAHSQSSVAASADGGV